MLLSANLFASFPSQLLLGAILLLAGETGGGRYGLCRIYSYNVQFQPSGRHHHTADDKRYFFACCADAGNEFSCHDQTLQNLRRHEEFCRGELLSRDGIVSHWTQDETDLFTGGDLLYCGGCCGQHIATNICNEQQRARDDKPLQVPGNTINLPGSGCDAWIDCFVRQCKKITADVLANQPLKCSVPPPPYPKHFIQQRRALPFNLTAILGAQLTRSTGHKSTTTDQFNGHHTQQTQDCDRLACYQLDPATRCSTACCQHTACCPPKARGSIGLLQERDRLLTILILTLACVLFLTLSVIFSLALFLPDRRSRRFPGTSQDSDRRPESSGALDRLQQTVRRCRDSCCSTDDGGEMLVVVDCDDAAADDVDDAGGKVASDDDDSV